MWLDRIIQKNSQKGIRESFSNCTPTPDDPFDLSGGLSGGLAQISSVTKVTKSGFAAPLKHPTRSATLSHADAIERLGFSRGTKGPSRAATSARNPGGRHASRALLLEPTASAPNCPALYQATPVVARLVEKPTSIPKSVLSISMRGTACCPLQNRSGTPVVAALTLSHVQLSRW